MRLCHNELTARNLRALQIFDTYHVFLISFTTHHISLSNQGNAFTTLAIRFTHALNDPLATLNQGALMTVGGVVMLQFLGVSQAPQFMREWILREVTETSETCQIKSYPGTTCADGFSRTTLDAHLQTLTRLQILLLSSPGPADSGNSVQTIRIAYSLPKSTLVSPDHLQARFLCLVRSPCMISIPSHQYLTHTFN